MLTPIEKDLRKFNKELVEIHKRCIKNYLIQKNLKRTGRNKFFHLYDHYINENNIRIYYLRPIDLFVYALVTNRLDEIENYTHNH